MQLKNIFIDGFGIFSNKKLDFIAGLNIVFGNNEAGKTTLLSFLRSMFFGKKGAEKYPPLSGGNHGGIIIMEDSRGEEIKIERDFSARRYIFQKANGTVVTESEFSKMIGNPTETLFNNVFCFGLDELADFKTLCDEEVSGRIYSAGLGSTKSLVSINGEIEKIMESIYKKGGRKDDREVKRIANTLQELEFKIKSLKEIPHKYNELKAELAELEEQLQNDEEKQVELKKEIAFYESLLKGWEHWLKIREYEEKLNSLEKIENFPPNGLSILESLKSQLKEVELEIEVKESSFRQIARDLESLAIDNFILENRTDIENLKDNLALFNENRQHMEQLKREFETTCSKLKDILHNLGSTWDEKKLQRADVSLQTTAEIENYRKRFEDIGWQKRTLQSTIYDLKKEKNELHEEIQKKTAEKDKLIKSLVFKGNPEEIKDTIYRMENLFESKKLVQLKNENLEQNLKILRKQFSEYESDVNNFKFFGKGVKISTALLFATIFSIPIYLLSNNVFYGILAFFSGVLFGTATVLIIEKIITNQFRKDKKEKLVRLAEIKDIIYTNEIELEKSNKELAAIDEKLGKLAGLFFQKKEFSDEEIYEVKRKLEKDISTETRISIIDDSLSHLEKRLTTKKREIKELEEKIELLKKESYSLMQKWQDYLSARGLPDELLPENMGNVIEAVKKGKDLLEDKNSLEKEIASRENSIKKYACKVSELTGREYKIPEDAEQITTEVRNLQDKLLETTELVSKKEQLLAKKQSAWQSLEKEKEKLKKINKEIRDLFILAGAENEESFLQRFEIYKKRQLFSDNLATHTANLKAISQGFEFKLYKKILSESNLTILKDKLEKLHGELRGLAKRLAENRELKGSIITRLESMCNDEKLAECLFKRNIYQEKLKNAAKKWVVHAMAKEMINLAKEKYERERQPAVLKNASRYIKLITDGKYQKIFSPYGEHVLRLENNRGKTCELSQLSRGTAEQLYMSMRYALVEEFAKRAESLPVIMDDTFVNFDEIRIKRTAQAVHELLKTNQVLFFTCHRHIVKIFKDVFQQERIHVINL
ncbi:MAG: hypothetical protein PWQ96_543 [Clostridia bacterium]|jgi:uncharacterized protein YhaN|nr:hypothetical protein [Clostridiales bacterium]MDK2984901.1 hypothetical protein [Clostridia bacterium]